MLIDDRRPVAADDDLGDSAREDVLSGNRSGSQPLTYRRYRSGEWQTVIGAVSVEARVTIFVNRRELVTVLCTPVRVNHLVLGFLANEGIIDSLDDLLMMRVCDEDATADVRLKNEPPASLWEHRTLTSGCGGGVSLDELARDLPVVESPLVVSPEQVFDLMKQLQGASSIYRHCGGVHAGGLADSCRLIASAEDIGRHNTIDKIRGQCLLEERSTNGHILLTTGRLSSEVVRKAAKMGTPIVVSRNSATGRAIELSERLGITLAGYARADSLTVYSHPQRIAGAT